MVLSLELPETLPIPHLSCILVYDMGTTSSSTDRDTEFVRFVSLLLHDLESPLAVAKQFLTRVEQGRHDPDNPLHRKLVRSTQLAIARAERTLEDILDQARYSDSKLRIQREPTDVRELIAECVAVVLPLAEDRDLRITTKMDPALPGRMGLDPRLTARVVDNLLVNAVRYAPRDTSIDISLTGEDGNLRVVVANTAMEGFNADLEHFFDPSHQVELRRNHQPTGVGLGLSYCRMAVRALGGNIGARRGREGEIVFWFELPMKQAKR